MRYASLVLSRVVVTVFPLRDITLARFVYVTRVVLICSFIVLVLSFSFSCYLYARSLVILARLFLSAIALFLSLFLSLFVLVVISIWLINLHIRSSYLSFVARYPFLLARLGHM